jgi:hypothetical protein
MGVAPVEQEGAGVESQVLRFPQPPLQAGPDVTVQRAQPSDIDIRVQIHIAGVSGCRVHFGCIMLSWNRAAGPPFSRNLNKKYLTIFNLS